MSKFQAGEQVIIRKDTTSYGYSGWNRAMDQYVWQTTQIKGLWIGSPVGFHEYYYVEADGGVWIWYSDFLIPVTTTALIVQSPDFMVVKRSDAMDGCKCSKCGDFVPYVESSPSFLCYRCRHP